MGFDACPSDTQSARLLFHTHSGTPGARCFGALSIVAEQDAIRNPIAEPDIGLWIDPGTSQPRAGSEQQPPVRTHTARRGG
jgi:hypothetical protein